MKIEQLVIYPEIYYQVKYWWDDSNGFTGLNFIAHRIRSLVENEKGVEVPDEIDDEKCLEGHLKFDGCMNVLLEQGYAHFCGRHQTKQYCELFNKIYGKAKELGCTYIT